VSVIASPPNVEDASAISASQVERCLELVRGEFDRVILDVSDPWEEVSLRALGMADRILVVTTIDVPSLSHTKRHVELLEQLGAGRDQIRVIVNRTSTGDYLDIREVENFLERPPDAVIPEDVATSTQSVNEGRLVRDVAPNSKLDRAFSNLAEQTYPWCELQAPVTRPQKGLTERLRELVLRR
jgi:pilus assembly protein CpaE